MHRRRSTGTWNPWIAAAVLGAVLVFAGALWSGCKPKPSTIVPLPGQGPLIASSAEIDPTASPSSKASVTLEGSKFKVDLDAENDPDAHKFLIEVTRDGEHFDLEMYENYPGAFSLEKAAGEEFEPAIPLLKFPMHVGDTWNWSGTTSADGDALPATAIVTSEQKASFISGVPVDATVVHVNLTLQAKKPIERELNFWFAKGKGLFRREFGEHSVREPLD